MKKKLKINNWDIQKMQQQQKKQKITLSYSVHENHYIIYKKYKILCPNCHLAYKPKIK
jgi:hypothetical protein